MPIGTLDRIPCGGMFQTVWGCYARQNSVHVGRDDLLATVLSLVCN